MRTAARAAREAEPRQQALLRLRPAARAPRPGAGLPVVVPADQQELYVLAEKKIAEAAQASDLRNRADQNTKVMLEGMLKSPRLQQGHRQVHRRDLSPPEPIPPVRGLAVTRTGARSVARSPGPSAIGLQEFVGGGVGSSRASRTRWRGRRGAGRRAGGRCGSAGWRGRSPRSRRAPWRGGGGPARPSLSQARWSPRASTTSSTPSSLRHGRHDRRPPARSASAIMLRRSRSSPGRPSRSALFTTNTSAISRMPALAAWMASPMPGASSTRVVSASEAISTSAWPTPTVSTRTTSQPAARAPARLGRGPGQPAEVAAAGHRPDEDARVGGVVLHPDPVAEQRPAGERRGRVDGQHADPQVLARNARTSALVEVDLPTPGEPVRPMTWPVPASGAQRRHDLAELRRGVLDQGDQPGHRPRLALPGPRDQVVDVGLPRQVDGPSDLQDQGVALAAAAAQPGRAEPPPRRRSSCARCSTMRAPDMPIGWPSAIAPPLTLTLSRPRRGPCVDWRPTEANASLISIRSRSPTPSPCLPSACLMALAGWDCSELSGPGDVAVRADLGEPGRARAPRPWPWTSRRPRRRRRRSARRTRR